ncbi:hypothetical protein JKP88DRAFT_252828 [Tribonema minus]|uniref:Uncharacterized protein n=1 Tax=Tribonema minus TaxID=303371 RepID=A0A835ZIC1_9STRA|nr:hypothetical protein JKP88DRAFT_252828 [Tribonema minus]
MSDARRAQLDDLLMSIDGRLKDYQRDVLGREDVRALLVMNGIYTQDSIESFTYEKLSAVQHPDTKRCIPAGAAKGLKQVFPADVAPCHILPLRHVCLCSQELSNVELAVLVALKVAVAGHGRSTVQARDNDVGTALHTARTSEDGLCIGAAHVCVDGSKFLTATAFDGQEMDLIASFPYYDIIFLRGPKGDAFSLTTTQMPGIGKDIMMLAHPAAPQQNIRTEGTPVVGWGRMAAVDQTLELAAGVQHSVPIAALGQEAAPQNRVVTGKDNMWSERMRCTPHGKKRRTPAAASEYQLTQEKLGRLALQAVANVQHNDQLVLFVPARFIAHLATCANAMGPSALRQMPRARR